MRLISVLLLLVSSQVFSQTTSESILFLDLNDNPKEIAVARAGAKARGQKLLVYPPKDEEFTEEKLRAYINKNPFRSLVVSGHNGGSSYHGDKGEIEINTLVSMVEASPSAKKLSALYLLGCNGANKSKIFFWKQGIPSLGMIAGYDGLAPIGSDSRGLEYFGDTLKKENQILHGANHEAIKKLLEGLKSVNAFDSSVYVSCTPEKQQYLFLSQEKGSAKFAILNTKECISKLSEFKAKYLEKIKKYWAGDLEATSVDPSNGFLTEAYVYLRKNEHCLVDDDKEALFDKITGDNLLFLRFNKAFNQNYLEYYHDDFKLQLEHLDAILKDSDQLAEKEFQHAKTSRDFLKDVSEHPEKFRSVIDTEMLRVLEDQKNYLKKNPDFEICLKNPVPSCQRVMAKFLEYHVLTARGESLLDFQAKAKKNIDQEFALSTYQYFYKDLAQKEEIKTLRSLLAKAVNEPSTVTRKDLLNISKQYGSVLSLVRFNQEFRFNMFIKAPEELSGSVIPFSWHERLPGKKAEAPKAGYMKKDGYFKSRFPKEMETLGYLLDAETY